MQYLVIYPDEKEYEKEYVYVKLNHFAIHQKLTVHCKSALFQFLKIHFD